MQRIKSAKTNAGNDAAALGDDLLRAVDGGGDTTTNDTKTDFDWTHLEDNSTTDIHDNGNDNHRENNSNSKNENSPVSIGPTTNNTNITNNNYNY